LLKKNISDQISEVNSRTPDSTMAPPASDRASERDICERIRRLEGGGLRTFVTPHPLVIAGAKGPWLRGADGREYLDFAGSFAVTTTGHGHPAVVAAIKAQAEKLIHCPSAYPSELRAEFLEAIESICQPLLGDLAIMPAMSGAMANEMAVSLVRHLKPGCEFVAFSGGYFGRSVGTSTFAGKARYRQAQALGPAAHFAPFPYPLRFGEGATDFTMRYLETLTASGGGGGQIGAVVVEPIQGNGGLIVPPADFFPRLRQLCDRIGALLVIDEIQSGCGRSGTMWAIEHFGVKPDLMTIGKGIGGNMGVAALVGRRDLMAWTPDAYSSTFMINHIGLAASVAAIQIIRDEGLPERSRVLGTKHLPLLQERLDKLAQVAEVRGKGLWFAIEFAAPPDSSAGKFASTVSARLRENGVVMGGGGYDGEVLKICPPLNIDEADLAAGLDKVCRVIGELH
jgi:4-aminobutyrate aminotransferase-like enzyme